MLLQIFQGARNAPAAEILGTGADVLAPVTQAPGEQRGGCLEVPHANRQIIALAHHVDLLVGERQFEPQMRMAQQKLVEQRRDEALAEGRGTGDPERSPGFMLLLHEERLGGMEFIERSAAAFVIGSSRFGEAHAARSAM